jgi:hypothetical protein
VPAVPVDAGGHSSGPDHVAGGSLAGKDSSSASSSSSLSSARTSSASEGESLSAMRTLLSRCLNVAPMYSAFHRNGSAPARARMGSPHEVATPRTSEQWGLCCAVRGLGLDPRSPDWARSRLSKTSM